MGHFLWKQVGYMRFFFYRAALKQPLWIFIRKGIVWLFIAMVAGVIPVVSLATFLHASSHVS